MIAGRGRTVSSSLSEASSPVSTTTLSDRVSFPSSPTTTTTTTLPANADGWSRDVDSLVTRRKEEDDEQQGEIDGDRDSRSGRSKLSSSSRMSSSDSSTMTALLDGVKGRGGEEDLLFKRRERSISSSESLSSVSSSRTQTQRGQTGSNGDNDGSSSNNPSISMSSNGCDRSMSYLCQSSAISTPSTITPGHSDPATPTATPTTTTTTTTKNLLVGKTTELIESIEGGGGEAIYWQGSKNAGIVCGIEGKEEEQEGQEPEQGEQAARARQGKGNGHVGQEQRERAIRRVGEGESRVSTLSKGNNWGGDGRREHEQEREREEQRINTERSPGEEVQEEEHTYPSCPTSSSDASSSPELPVHATGTITSITASPPPPTSKRRSINHTLLSAIDTATLLPLTQSNPLNIAAPSSPLQRSRHHHPHHPHHYLHHDHVGQQPALTATHSSTHGAELDEEAQHHSPLSSSSRDLAVYPPQGASSSSIQTFDGSDCRLFEQQHRREGDKNDKKGDEGHEQDSSSRSSSSRASVLVDPEGGAAYAHAYPLSPSQRPSLLLHHLTTLQPPPPQLSRLVIGAEGDGERGGHQGADSLVISSTSRRQSGWTTDSSSSDSSSPFSPLSQELSPTTITSSSPPPPHSTTFTGLSLSLPTSPTHFPSSSPPPYPHIHLPYPFSTARTATATAESGSESETATDSTTLSPHSRSSRRSKALPLTPLEEVNSPEMLLDSPADLVESANPFDQVAVGNAASTANTHHQSSLAGIGAAQLEQSLSLLQLERRSSQNDADETFYHTLLELVNTEAGYADDLTNLVEVHFSLLSFARFVTEEQRNIIIRDAARLLDLHRRLVARLKRVDEDLGWIREDDEVEEMRSSSSDDSCEHGDEAVDQELRDAVRTLAPHGRLSLGSADTSLNALEGVLRSSTSASAPTSPVKSTFASYLRPRRTVTRTRRFKSSDATVLDAARRISAIYLNEAQNLSDAYRPFCSGHSEAMEVVKFLSSSGSRLEWDSFEAQCTLHLAQRKRKSSSIRLHFADFLIKPVQRICRYPLLFGNLLKNAQATALARGISPPALGTVSSSLNVSSPGLTCESQKESPFNHHLQRIKEVLDVLKGVAADVDHAQKQRSLEIATVKLARRIEVQNSEHTNLLNRLSQVILIGSAHVIYTHAPTAALQGPAPVVKAGFYGLVLYESHLVFFKVKKTNVYEPRHWLPLRLFDMAKIPDGEGLLPYAFRLHFQDHSFEVGSLCHAEQNIWTSAIEHASAACRKAWTEGVASNPVAFDDSPVCSVSLDLAGLELEATSPVFSNSDGVAFPASPESTTPGATNGRPPSFVSVGSDDQYASFRPRLSLKPPAQRVGVDLRLADLLSESILTARAQSKRSHAMPLHGPPPRSSTSPSSALGSALHRRPHSFHPGGFSYRSFVDSTASTSRRTSLAESDGSRPSLGSRPAGSSSTITGVSTVGGSMTTTPGDTTDDTLRRKPSKLRRSKTSVQVSEQGALLAPGPPKHQRRSSTLGKIRRRATSLVSDSSAMKALEELRTERQAELAGVARPAVTINTRVAIASGPISTVESVILEESAQATVARNSSTSSSSSYASNSTNPSLQSAGNSVETPQSSLPASPLLTPVDLETQSRWTKIGDALSHTLTRKRSFASSRPILSIPPEPLLEGIQLEQARDAAEYIYTGRHTCGSTCSHHGGTSSGTHSAATSAHSQDRRYSWDRLGWNPLTITGSSSSKTGFGSHHRAHSGASAPSSTVGLSHRHIAAGRSAPNLSAMADKRQASSSSLWSVFRNGGVETFASSHASSPTPSIYEDAQETEDDSSAYPSPAGHFTPLPEIHEVAADLGTMQPTQSSASNAPAQSALQTIPVTRLSPLALSAALPSASNASFTGAAIPAQPATPSASSSLLSPPAAGPNGQAIAHMRTGTGLKRKNSLSARLRAFRSLGSGMTPVRQQQQQQQQQQPSRSYLT